MENTGNPMVRADKKVPKETSLPWVFTDRPVTAWGGLRLMKEMLMRMGLREELKRCGLPVAQSNRGYDPEEMIESFLVCIWAGGVRFAHTQLVRFDKALCEIFGWKQVASVSTFTRFFRRFKRERVDEVFGHIQGWFWNQISPKTLTIDLDSSVITRYGEQEGTAKGYNPQKKGRRSHHPLFAFVADLRMVLHAWLRPGNTASCNGANEFFKEAIRLLGDRHRISLVRADSGFFFGEFMTLLEAKVFHYIIAVRMNSIVHAQMVGLSNWISVDTGIAVSEMEYQAQGWDRKRRIIVVRQALKERPDARGKLLFEIPGYRYQSYVTDLDLAAVEIWRLYRGRADAENRIEELKYDFGITGFCLNSFYGTEAAFRTILLAYNLMSLFRQALLQAPKAHRLSTIRFQCFALGSWIGRKARKKVLRISLSGDRRPWFEGLFSKIQAFNPPWLAQI